MPEEASVLPLVSSKWSNFSGRARELLRQVLWPSGLGNRLGRILGALSIFALAKFTLGAGISAAFQLVLAYYERLLDVLLGWAEPLIEIGLSQVRDYFSVPVVLYGHWKHVFVLLGIYFFREVGVARHTGSGSVVPKFIHGLIVALVCSVATGAIPLNQSDLVANFMIAAIPILGVAVYGVIQFAWDATFLRDQVAKVRGIPTSSWREYFAWGVFRVCRRTAAGLLLLYIGLRAPVVQETPTPGLLMLAVLTLAFALNWFWDGVLASARIRLQGESRWEAYVRSSSTQLGLAMTGTFVWGLIFMLVNAGLGSYGL